MLSDPYTIYIDGYTDKTVTAALLPQQTDGRTVRALSAPAGYDRGEYPELLTIARRVVGRGVAVRDRLALRLEGVSVDASSGADVFGTHPPPVMTLVCDFPRNYINESIGDMSARYLVGILRGLDGNTADIVAYDEYYYKILAGQA